MSLALAWSLAAVPAAGQQGPTVTLEEAIEAARRSSSDVLAARARAEAAGQARRAASSFLWPTVGVEAGAVRSNDPVAAFGARLRQGRFAQADFDPGRLNAPDPITDWSAAVGTAWSPVNASAWAGRDAAALDAEAAGLGADWAERAAAFRAEVRYLEAVMAERSLEAADATVSAAEANLDLLARRRDEGLVTDADVLQAEAALAAANAGVIDARRGVADARARLAVAMGLEPGVAPVPAGPVRSEWAATPAAELERRADLRASARGLEAARARAEQAGRARLPTVEAFARVATHSNEAFDVLEDDWTVGVQVRVPVFTGFEITSRAKAAAAARDAAAHEHEARLRDARAGLAEAVRAADAAAEGLVAARAAADAAVEASRLMRRRFEEGMATTADLLTAEGRAAELRAAAVRAELMRHLAHARVVFLQTDSFDRGTDR